MATLYAKFTTVGTHRETGETRVMRRFVVAAEFEPGATLRESLAAARESAWREAIEHDALLSEASEL